MKLLRKRIDAVKVIYVGGTKKIDKKKNRSPDLLPGSKICYLNILLNYFDCRHASIYIAPGTVNELGLGLVN